MLPAKAPTGSCHIIASTNASAKHVVVDAVKVDVMRAVV